MIIKKFLAKSEKDAIEMAKNELGNNAIVMNIKKVKPTILSTFGVEKSCLLKILPTSASLEPFVTKIPVDNEIIRDGIWLTRPSPIVKIEYL